MDPSSDFMNRETACVALEVDRDLLLAAIESDVAPEISHNPLGADSMTVIDLASHVLMWDEIVLAVLTEARAGRMHWSLDAQWETREAGRALNVGGVAAGRQWAPELVVHRFRAVREALVSELRSLSDEEWHAPLAFAHSGTLPQTLAGLSYYVSTPEADPTRSRIYQHATVHLGL